MSFGGITMLLCGDFRQTLPVILRAGPAEVISSTIKRSELWRYFEWLRLSINMRVQTSRNPQTAAEVGAFADYLLQVGDGRHFISPTLGPDFIKVPEDMLFDISSLPQSNIEKQARNRLLHLVETVYTDLNSRSHPDDYFADIIILTPKNTDVLAINNLILEKIPGEMHEFTSVDSVDGDDELQRQEHGDLYPPEFLNTISLSGMPPHKLCLKVGTPVIYDQIAWRLQDSIYQNQFSFTGNFMWHCPGLLPETT
ncbi:Helitron helicase [Phytophthora megakarya]|uniref:ATP-dependent DNA helicase n=1 Tax=Phytophthora megakarya TaxID=4795 RepID=A0A225WV72_9STRA|nr:Helitron helicase [Phytophthora megakarya]